MDGGRGGLPDTKRGGGQSTSGPIYEKWGGGGGGAIRFRSITKRGGAIRFMSITKSGVGAISFMSITKSGVGAILFRSITKSRGWGQFASGPLRKVGGGGERCKLPHWGLGRSPRSFASRDPHHISGP